MPGSRHSILCFPCVGDRARQIRASVFSPIRFGLDKNVCHTTHGTFSKRFKISTFLCETRMGILDLTGLWIKPLQSHLCTSSQHDHYEKGTGLRGDLSETSKAECPKRQRKARKITNGQIFPVSLLHVSGRFLTGLLLEVLPLVRFLQPF